MRRNRWLVSLLVVVGLVAAACSDDDDAAAPASSAVRSTAPEVTATAATTEPSADTSPATTAAPATTAEVATTPAPPTTVPLPASGYPAQPAGVAYPAAGPTWPTAALPTGVDQTVLDAAADRAFGAPDATGRVQSIVVVKGGSIVYERYHPLDGPDKVYPAYSVAKSLVSSLIGLVVTDGLLALDQHPPRPEWPDGDPRQAITLRQLLQMSSGLEWTEDFTPGGVAAASLDAPSAANIAASQGLESEPGSTFEFSTGTSALLVGIAADALGGCQAATDYLRARLLDPIGITTAVLPTDPGGCWLGTGGGMTTRDFARFGLLYLRGGMWNGTQVLPTSWIDETRVPAATNPKFGLHWWVNEDGKAFYAQGLFGQLIVVVPEDDLVIAINATQGGDSYSLVDAVLAEFEGRPAPPPPSTTVPPTTIAPPSSIAAPAG